MKWNRIRRGRCPKCNTVMIKKKYIYSCSNCYNQYEFDFHDPLGISWKQINNKEKNK